MKTKKKSLFCKLGFHKVDKEHCFAKRNWRNRCQIISRHAFCIKCEKKLYRVDRYGDRRK